MYTLSILIQDYDEDFVLVQRDGGSRIPAGRTISYQGASPLAAYNAFFADVNVANWNTGEQYSALYGRLNPDSKVTLFAHLFFKDLRNYMTDHVRAVETNNIPHYYTASPSQWDFLFKGTTLHRDLTFAFEYKGNYKSIRITCHKDKLP